MYTLTEREDLKGSKKTTIAQAEDLNKLISIAPFLDPSKVVEIYKGRRLVWSRKDGYIINERV